ncbi:MAG: N-acetyltransferase, partial [Chrysiogenetes bacterium]|nr:N-acetyltransferase [Chrysiogenetes bacterium]
MNAQKAPTLTPEVIESLRDIDPASWNALVGAGNPFCEWEFLYGLETTGCVGPRTGWLPRFITVKDG